MYCGWNIDDVQIFGVEDATIGVTEMPVNKILSAVNYPNPFRSETVIEYKLAEASHVSLAIYDIQGKMVASLVDGQQAAGIQIVTWNGTDRYGNKMPSGIFSCIIRTNNAVVSRKLLMISE
jgi:flagellar hook assembly protein FlgD